jgi:glycosyltransferase involved in cell wall biosynthesis
VIRQPTGLNQIAVDLTPLLPGGANGGAAIVAVQVVRELANLAPSIRFKLLTNYTTHADLAHLDAPNVERLCVVSEPDPGDRLQTVRAHARSLGRAALDRLVPSAGRVRIKNAYWGVAKRRARAHIAASLECDLLFCPFTAPYYQDDKVPLVAIIYDLQHLAYPEFFEADQRRYRQQHIEDACQRAARVLCISDHVRATLVASVSMPPERAVTVHLGLLQPLATPTQEETQTVLRHLGIQPDRFLLYPANFWAHKNHRALVDAHRLFKERHPESDLTVVCTGAPDARMAAVAEYAGSRSPGGFVFPGFLSEAELSALYSSCAALIYPSLYEGFGMPLLEAMAHARPVLCSNVTSLPEIAGDAAILFDPHDVGQIADAILAVEEQRDIVCERARRGPDRARLFGTAADVALRYLTVFQDVATENARGALAPC